MAPKLSRAAAVRKARSNKATKPSKATGSKPRQLARARKEQCKKASTLSKPKGRVAKKLPPKTLDALPTEILIAIFAHIPSKEINRTDLILACKYFFNILKRSKTLLITRIAEAQYPITAQFSQFDEKKPKKNMKWIKLLEILDEKAKTTVHDWEAAYEKLAALRGNGQDNGMLLSKQETVIGIHAAAAVEQLGSVCGHGGHVLQFLSRLSKSQGKILGCLARDMFEMIRQYYDRDGPKSFLACDQHSPAAGWQAGVRWIWFENELMYRGVSAIADRYLTGNKHKGDDTCFSCHLFGGEQPRNYAGWRVDVMLDSAFNEE